MSDRALWWGSFLAFAAMTVLWAVSSPVLSGPDEPAHAVRAAAMGHGQLLGHTEVVRNREPGGNNATYTTFAVPEGWGALHDVRCYQADPFETADCLPALPTEGPPGTAVTTAGTYQPLYYLAVGWVAAPLDVAPALWSMRIITALMTSALLASAVLSLRRWSNPVVAAVGLLAAVTPMLLFIAGVVNPSGIEIAAGIGLWAGLAALVSGEAAPERALVRRLGVAAVVFAWARPSSPFLLVALVAATILLAADRDVLRSLWAGRHARGVGAVIGLGWASSLGWSFATGALDAFGGQARPDLTTSAIVQHSWDNTAQRFEQMVGVLGWLDTTLPPFVWEPWLEITAALLVSALVLGTWRQRGVLVLIVAGVIMLPILAEVQSARMIGFAWQGRYSLPLAVGIPLGSTWVLARTGRAPRTASLWVLTALAGFFAGSHVLAHVASMRRYSLGRDALLRAYLTEPGWQAPIADVPLLGLFTAAALALVGVAGVVARTRPSAEPVPSDAPVVGR